MDDFSNDPKMQAYMQKLGQDEDQKAKFQDWLQQHNQAMGAAAKGLMATPEDQAMAAQNLDPITRGLMGGGAMAGSVEDAAQAARSAFPKLQSMFQAGDITFPAENTAQAIQVQNALRAAGKVSPENTLVQLGKIKGQ